MSEELSWIAEALGATRVRRAERVQSLWSGYGEIFRVYVSGAEVETAVVKWVKPPPRTKRAADDRGHRRKCRSYDVELAWYRTYAARCDDACRVPALLASRAANGEWLIVLEDLDAAGFSERHRDLRPPALEACLAWLASLHATFMGAPPEGLWKTGTYWHLATRPDELAVIEDAALRAAAPALDERLEACAHKTIIHGDAKPANFCFARRARDVAAVDFQYVGGGCGMKDVAYLLSRECADDAEERRHLDTYFRLLRAALVGKGAAADVDAIEAEWRGLYAVACADYHRFLAGWAPDHYRRDAEGQRVVREVLKALA
jgi:hypothetical protein